MRILSAVLVLSLFPACYFGRSPSAKRAGYVANGTAVAAGSLIVLGAVTDNRCADSDFINDCSGAGAARAVLATLGAIVAASGLIGIGVNVAIPTKAPEADRPGPVTGQVTGPGLKPVVIHLP